VEGGGGVFFWEGDHFQQRTNVHRWPLVPPMWTSSELVLSPIPKANVLGAVSATCKPGRDGLDWPKAHHIEQRLAYTKAGVRAQGKTDVRMTKVKAKRDHEATRGSRKM